MMRVKRDELIELARLKAGELRMDQISDGALVVLGGIQGGGVITHVEQEDGSVITTDRTDPEYLRGLRDGAPR